MITTRREQVNTLVRRGQFCSAYNVSLQHGLNDMCDVIKQQCRTNGAVKFYHCEQTGRLKTIEFEAMTGG